MFPTCHAHAGNRWSWLGTVLVSKTAIFQYFHRQQITTYNQQPLRHRPRLQTRAQAACAVVETQGLSSAAALQGLWILLTGRKICAQVATGQSSAWAGARRRRGESARAS